MGSTTMSVDTDSERQEGDDAPGLTTIARDVLREWKLWLAMLAALGIAGYAFVFDRGMPNGYVPFFTLLGTFAALYGFHDMRTTPNLV